MKGKIALERGKKKVPLILMAIGVALALALLIVRLNIVAILCVLYCCILSAVFIIALIAKHKVYAPMVYGFAAALAGVAAYYIIWGADAGFGAFSSGLAGYSSAENSLFTGEGNFGTRLLGNILLALPCSLCLWGLFFVARKSFKKEGAKKALSGLLSVLLTGCCVFYVFTMNLRAKPNTERLWEGHDDYLSHVDKTATADSPNVLFILMDDLGWGDVSLNGAIYDTPNIDSIGENGVSGGNVRRQAHGKFDESDVFENVTCDARKLVELRRAPARFTETRAGGKFFPGDVKRHSRLAGIFPVSVPARLHRNFHEQRKFSAGGNAGGGSENGGVGSRRVRLREQRAREEIRFGGGNLRARAGQSRRQQNGKKSEQFFHTIPSFRKTKQKSVPASKENVRRGNATRFFLSNNPRGINSFRPLRTPPFPPRPWRVPPPRCARGFFCAPPLRGVCGARPPAPRPR